MPGTFEDEVRAEMEALRAFSHEQEQRCATEKRRAIEDATGGVDGLGLPQVRALIADRFENARLRKRLPEAERRIAELEQAIGRT